MNIYSEANNLIYENVSDFDIDDILLCGQCFHFDKLGDKEYELIAYGKYLHIKQFDNKVILYDTSMEEHNIIWSKYFDLDNDYGKIKQAIIKADERLKTAIDAKKGIRILNQEFFEMLISFIISQNKQIPHIKQIVRTISDKYGDVIKCVDGRTIHAFPTVDALNRVSVEELRECKVGFRAPYIRDAVDKVYSGEISYEVLVGLSADEARAKLMSIKGVGEKVANCVMLFSLGFRDAFPVDVWMKRIMEYMYFGEDTDKKIIEKFAYEKFGTMSGYAQQYLFHYGRENGLGK